MNRATTNSYPTYYRSNNKFTVVMQDDFFVQVEKMTGISTFSVGRSKQVIERCENHDIVCTEDEFSDFFNQQVAVFQDYVALLSIVTGKTDN